MNQFRRSGQRDDRRRRLLADETLAASSEVDPCAAEAPARRSPHYGDAEFLEAPLRLVDLIPRRLITLTALLALALAAVAGLIWLHGAAANPATFFGSLRLRAFDLTAAGNLGDAFSALMFLLSAAAALVVYSIRRHRSDDYHGRYRVWVWAALVWLLLATDEIASLHEAWQTFMVRLSGTTLFGDGAIWWIGLYLFVVGAVAIRLLIDLYGSRLATIAFTLCGVTLLIDVAARLALLPSGVMAAVGSALLSPCCEMVGGVLLLFAMLLQARFVLRDAEGSLPPPRPKAVRKKSRRRSDLDSAAAADGETPRDASDTGDDATEGVSPARGKRLRIDPPHPTPASPAVSVVRSAAAPASGPSRPASVDSASGTSTSSVALNSPIADRSSATAYSTAASKPSSTPAANAATAESAQNKLSKADRKALKQRLIQERLQREKQQRAKW